MTLSLPRLTKAKLNVVIFYKARMRMLFTIALILVILWLLGFISSYTLGGWIHILLIAALIALVIRLIAGPPRPRLPPGY